LRTTWKEFISLAANHPLKEVVFEEED